MSYYPRFTVICLFPPDEREATGDTASEAVAILIGKLANTFDLEEPITIRLCRGAFFEDLILDWNDGIRETFARVQVAGARLWEASRVST
jgi:hypothetical protein